MKNILKYVSILSALLTWSCADDFLNTQSPSKQSPEVIYNSLTLTDNAVLGAYNSLLKSLYKGDCVLYWQGNTDIETTYRGFNVDMYKDVGSGGFGNYFNTPQNRQNQWESFYASVEMATNVIDGIRQSPILSTYPAEMKSLLGEALTIRAMVYAHLVKHYGDVPFRKGTAAPDMSNIYTGRVDRDTIYHYIIRDLQEAVGYLPYMGGKAGSRSLTTPQRITKGYAKGLLGRVALAAAGWSLRDGNEFPKNSSQIEKHPSIPQTTGYYTGRVPEPLRRQYYEIAAQQCGELIGDPKNPHGLDPSFENIWKTVCRYEFNPYKENLYQFAYGMGQNGDVLGNLMGYPTAGGDKWGRRMHGGYCSSTGYYFYSFDKTDSRRSATLVTTSWNAENKEVMANNGTSISFGKWRIYWMTDGFLSLNRVGTDGRIPNGINWIDMRYSDVLLMFAEAYNELHGPDAVDPVAGLSSRTALERVRERAFGVGHPKITDYDGSSKEAFFNAVVNERGWEFGGELIRKGDLIRWGLLGEKIETMKRQLCQLLANRDVQCFDKHYTEGTLPQTVYYKYKNTEYIDAASINYYSRTIPTDGIYLTVGWYSDDKFKSFNSNAAGILLSSTGLYAENADYNSFLDGLNITYGTIIPDVKASLDARYSFTGNKSCNNRYLNPIYYTEINTSRGSLKNSYGY